MNEAIRMQVSAFVDGELPENEAELLVRRLSQDAALRQQVAEYLAIGRIMRGEYNVRGGDALRARITAELDERPLQDSANTVAGGKSPRYLRPLAGFAIAASVALVAIVGLRQTIGVDAEPPATMAAEEVVSETVPALNDEEMRQFYLLHGESSNTFNARWTAAQIRADELVDEEAAESDDEDDADQSVSDQP